MKKILKGRRSAESAKEAMKIKRILTKCIDDPGAERLIVKMTDVNLSPEVRH